MAANQDFMLKGVEGDLLINNGDFVVNNSIDQNIYDILISIPGMWQQFPAMGVNLNQYQNGLTTGLDSLIRKQLTMDNFTVKNLKIDLSSNNKLTIYPQVTR